MSAPLSAPVLTALPAGAAAPTRASRTTSLVTRGRPATWARHGPPIAARCPGRRDGPHPAGRGTGPMPRAGHRPDAAGGHRSDAQGGLPGPMPRAATGPHAQRRTPVRFPPAANRSDAARVPGRCRAALVRCRRRRAGRCRAPRPGRCRCGHRADAARRDGSHARVRRDRAACRARRRPAAASRTVPFRARDRPMPRARTGRAARRHRPAAPDGPDAAGGDRPAAASRSDGAAAAERGRRRGRCRPGRCRRRGRESGPRRVRGRVRTGPLPQVPAADPRAWDPGWTSPAERAHERPAAGLGRLGRVPGRPRHRGQAARPDAAGRPTRCRLGAAGRRWRAGRGWPSAEWDAELVSGRAVLGRRAAGA